MTRPTSAVPKSQRIVQYWLPVFLMLTAQFVFSTDSFSSEHTSRFILPILKFLLPQFGIDRLIFLHHVIRKACHVGEYFVLGIFIYRALQSEMRNPVTVRTLTIIGIAGAAVFDEWHQSFVPARTSSLGDVGYDCIGGLCAILLMIVWRMTRMAQE